MTSADNVESQAWPVDPLVEWAELGRPTRVVRETPWASVVVWERNDSTLWGKAMCPGFAAECRLLPLLAKHCADQVLAPVRVDADRGLLLLPDGGSTLDATLDATVDIATWSATIVRYASLQLAMVGHEDELLDAGLVDLRPRHAVERLAGHMASGAVAARPHIVDWLGSVAEELGDDVPGTVQHDDLQPTNVLASGRIIDWGDTSLAHPFASLLTALMPGYDNRPGSSDERAAIGDAYLAAWAPTLQLDVERPADIAWLRRQAELAIALAPIGRIDTWLRAPAAALQEYPGAVERWVEHLERGWGAATGES